jgi:O-methyltransferase
MSRLNDHLQGDARRQVAMEYFRTDELPRLTDRAALYRRAADLVGRDKPVTYLEYGVAEGSSFREMVREFSHPDALFMGYDSFEGLPESWLMHNRGAFSSNGQIPVIGDPRARFVKGWFQNTFHTSLPWLAGRLTRSVLIHFDADLYYSTLFLLTSLWPHCSDYHFIFDDFIYDDVVALYDFSQAFPVEITILADCHGTAATLGHMRRTEFTL